MYVRISDFVSAWRNAQSNTIKIFSNITEDKKTIKVHEDVRSLERLAWHITQSITEMGARAGLFEEDFLEHTPIPPTFTDIIEIYEKYNALLSKAVHSKWTDSTLEDEVNMYGENWKKGKVLDVLIAHEAHHRSQMTVIMRLLSLPVPGICGPSKEEWAAMGLPAAE